MAMSTMSDGDADGHALSLSCDSVKASRNSMQTVAKHFFNYYFTALETIGTGLRKQA